MYATNVQQVVKSSLLESKVYGNEIPKFMCLRPTFSLYYVMKLVEHEKSSATNF